MSDVKVEPEPPEHELPELPEHEPRELPELLLPVEILPEERERAELEARMERSWVLRLESELARHSAVFVVGVGLMLIALIAVIDAGTEAFAVDVFYLVPIGLVTFGRGRWMGLLVAGLAAVGFGVADVYQGNAVLTESVTYVNVLTRFYGYAVIVLLIAPMREAMVMQRELAENESEAAEQLRAMQELHDVALSAGLHDVDEKRM